MEAALTDAQLMAKPFFRLDGNHANLETELQGKGQTILLAQAFPALTFAAGSNPVGVFGVLNNVNMMDEKSGWWSDKDEDERRWLHGDIKDVAYPYTYKVYDLMKDLGNLDQTN